jgi:large subunit ribosomal protein L9
LLPRQAKKGGGGAAAKIQVLLNDAVEGVGKKNEVVMVNTGYYNNFLRPKKLAAIISDDEVKVKVEKEQEELAAIKQDAINMGLDIEKLGPIVLKRKTGKNNNIFGTITHKQIADAIKEKTGGKITFSQKMKWTVPSVEGLGEFTCSVQLHPDVSQTVKVSVEPEKSK